MELLLAKIEEKLNHQTTLITTAVTQNVMEALDDRLKTITEENKRHELKIAELEQKIIAMDREKRKNNLVFFGLEEGGKTEAELVDYIKDIIIDTGVHLVSLEITKVYRIGRQTHDKIRPVVASFSTSWKKHLILKNRANFPAGIYVKEDYSKEVLEKRKQLQPQVEEERKKGNIAFIKYDKLIIKKPEDTVREKRKRETSGSPNASSSIQTKRVNTSNTSNSQTPQAGQKLPLHKASTKEVIKPNILKYVDRGRSASFSESSKNF